MPPRTNLFQQMMTVVYEAISPIGAVITESAMVKERDGVTEREVDILVEHEVAGIPVTLAIECRAHARNQTVEWIDGLIGKYASLPIDVVVAISPHPFTKAAVAKAAANKIQLISAKDAEKVDWPGSLNRQWRSMTHSFTLKRIIALDKAGNILSRTDVSDDGLIPEHLDAFSAAVYESLKVYFMRTGAEDAARALNDRIESEWQVFFDDPRPRVAEFSQGFQYPLPLNPPGFEPKQMSKLVCLVATIFKIDEMPTVRYLHKEHLVENFSGNPFTDVSVSGTFVRNASGQVIHAEFRAEDPTPSRKQRRQSAAKSRKKR